MEEQQEQNYTLRISQSENKELCCISPSSPCSVLPDLAQGFVDSPYYPPLLLPLRLRAVDKLKTIFLKQLSFHTSPQVLTQSPVSKNETKKVDLVKTEMRKAQSRFERLAAAETDEQNHYSATEATPKAPKSSVITRNENEGNNSTRTSKFTAPSLSYPTPLEETPNELLQETVPPPNASDGQNSVIEKMPLNLFTDVLPPKPTIPQLVSTTLSSTLPTPTPDESAPQPCMLPKNACSTTSQLSFTFHHSSSLFSNAPETPSKPDILSTRPQVTVSATPPLVPENGSATPPSSTPSMPLNTSKLLPQTPMQPKTGLQAPSPMTSLKKGFALPPPPPPGGSKALFSKISDTKLKRSSNMSNLYRVLKGKIEGSGQDIKPSNGRKGYVGSSSRSRQSMADAIAEMTKRSAYYIQIEDDVKAYAKTIMEMKSAINLFQTNDMAELLKFHQHIEHNLGKLSDETQVLARFEDFPSKKLETVRTAAALYSKLKQMVTILETWKTETPLCQLLDRVEKYFNKIKGETDTLERSKDEECKRFRSYNIDFDFTLFVRIKECMVDLSSSCMELALKENREVRQASKRETSHKTDNQQKACNKMLWRAFQLAFRVYTFAGGQDERAGGLSIKVADEIELMLGTSSTNTNICTPST